MFSNLMRNDAFRHALLERIKELGSTVFEAEKVNDVIDEHVLYMMESLKKDEKRFFGKDSEEKINSKIAPVRDFFEHRYAYMEGLLDKYETLR